MIPLILFILLGLIILVIFEWRARKEQSADTPDNTEAKNDAPVSECCGQHLVCERESLLQPNTEITYYDDEELDALSGKPAETYTQEETSQIEYVFHTLKEEEVAGWVRSMQLRNIALPQSVREEALLIIQERRKR